MLYPRTAILALLVAALASSMAFLSAPAIAAPLPNESGDQAVAFVYDNAPAASTALGFIYDGYLLLGASTTVSISDLAVAPNPGLVPKSRYTHDPSSDSVATNRPPTFRGDARSPAEVFDEGFQAVGDDLDLLRHAEGYPNSGYVSTSRSPSVAQEFGPNVYEVRAPGGIDVNDALGASSPLPWELEVAYPGGVPSSCIVGCTLPSGQWVPNPGFGPR